MPKLTITLLHDEPDRLVQLLYVAMDAIEKLDTDSYQANSLHLEDLLGNADYIIERVKDAARNSDEFRVIGDVIESR